MQGLTPLAIDCRPSGAGSNEGGALVPGAASWLRARAVRLNSLVRDSGDPILPLYILNNLGAGVPAQSLYGITVHQVRETARERLLILVWGRPTPPRRPNLLTDGRLREPLTRLKERLEDQREAVATLHWQEALVRLRPHFEALAREQVKNQEMLQRTLRELSKEDTEGIAERLGDEQPVLRWLAILVAQRKRLHVERELIDLLKDRTPQVREAARQALVRLSRGNDFGLARGPWLHWLSLQEGPGRRLVPTSPRERGP
jgi:hypothetical protein